MSNDILYQNYTNKIMKDINKMRLGVIRELKNLRIYIDKLERNVKSRNEDNIQKAYIFLVHLVREMNEGILTPDSIDLDIELSYLFQDLTNGFNKDE